MSDLHHFGRVFVYSLVGIIACAVLAYFVACAIAYPSDTEGEDDDS